MVLKINGEMCHNQVEIANHVNNFFVNVAHDLVSGLPYKTDSYSTFSDNCKSFNGSKGIIPGMFRLQGVSRACIVDQLKALKPSKSTGLVGFGPRFLKDGADALTDVVTYLVNLSITSKIVPACTKHAKVIPMYMKKSKLDVGNYRPVSVLTSIYIKGFREIRTLSG